MTATAISAATGQRQLRVGITGMTCAACAGRIERVLRKVPGVVSADVNLATEEAVVTGTSLTRVAIARAVEQSGYGIRSGKETGEAGHEAWWLAGGALLTLPLVAPMLTRLVHGGDWTLPALLQLALALPVQFGLGLPFYAGAWRALRGLSGNMDLLVAIGTTAAFGLSLHLMASGHLHHLYFESAAVIIVLVRLGKWLEKRARRQTLAALSALNALWPATARVRRDGVEMEVPLQQLNTGDMAIIRAGERLPADGRVVEGESEIDESLITGESRPRPVAPGDRVIGGAVNGMALIVIHVAATGAETVLARVIRMVSAAQGAKAPIQRLADRISAIFVPIVMMIAALTLAGWLATGASFETALVNAVAVLVIACPCALGLATPTAIMVGVGVGARRGILIRDAAAIETAGDIDVVAFDKTGTLTQGRPSLRAVDVLPGGDANSALAIAAAMQAGSTHALADALRTAAAGSELPRAEDARVVAGRGVIATVNGLSYALGNTRMMGEHAIATAPLAATAEKLEGEGSSISYLAEEGSAPRLLALFAFADQLKPASALAVEALHRLGIRVLMLTGDNKGAAARIAEELGLDDVRAGLLPEEKTAAIVALKADGSRVAMVGDGVNDAPALAAADLGLAMATGTDVAIETAGIALMRGDPALVPQAIGLARATRRKIKENLAWAFVFNLLGLPLAALGYLSPALAGGAMALSSVAVVSNALLLNRWRP